MTTTARKQTITRPQFEALRNAAPVAEWQDVSDTHHLACTKGRQVVWAQRNTTNVLIRLGLVEVVNSGTEWNQQIHALTPAGETVAADLEEGGPLAELDSIAHVVETTAAEDDAQQAAPQQPATVRMYEQTSCGITRRIPLEDGQWIVDHYRGDGSLFVKSMTETAAGAVDIVLKRGERIQLVPVDVVQYTQLQPVTVTRNGAQTTGRVELVHTDAEYVGVRLDSQTWRIVRFLRAEVAPTACGPQDIALTGSGGTAYIYCRSPKGHGGKRTP